MYSLLGYLNLLVKPPLLVNPPIYSFKKFLSEPNPLNQLLIYYYKGIIKGEHVTQLNWIELPHHLNNASLFTHYYRIGQTLT